MRQTSILKFLHRYDIRIAALAVLAAWSCVFAAMAHGQIASIPNGQPVMSSQTKGAAMQQFVLIFRQRRNVQVSPEEQAKRSEAIRAWATERLAEGYTFDPRVLSKESYEITPAGGEEAPERQVINLLFLTAKDFDDAVRIAKTHPGVGFGSYIEVRAWAPPAVPATK